MDLGVINSVNVSYTIGLGLKWNTFYPEIFRPVLYVLISVLGAKLLVVKLSYCGWGWLILKGGIAGVVSLLTGAFVMFDKKERDIIFSKFDRKE